MSEQAAISKKAARLRHSTSTALIGLALFISLEFFLHKFAPEGPLESRSPFGAYHAYHALTTTFGFSEPMARNVSLLELVPGDKCSLHDRSNSCLQLDALAVAIETLTPAAPRVIVLDKLIPDQCPSGQDDHFWKSIGNATKRGIHIVFASVYRDDGFKQTKLPDLDKYGIVKLKYSVGIANPAKDARALPPHFDHTQDGNSLAAAAAIAFDEDVERPLNRLQHAWKRNFFESMRSETFVTFIRPHNFPQSTICGLLTQSEDRVRWNHAGRIVVVGERTSDLYRVVFSERIPGFAIHASYIEAILGGHVLWNVPMFDIISGLALFIWFHWRVDQAHEGRNNFQAGKKTRQVLEILRIPHRMWAGIVAAISSLGVLLALFFATAFVVVAFAKVASFYWAPLGLYLTTAVVVVFRKMLELRHDH